MTLYREDPPPSDRGVRATNDICARITESRFRVDGRDLDLPMQIDDCSVVACTFWVAAKAAQRLLEPSSLTIAEPLPGKTLLVLLGVKYEQNPLGNYGEAAILLPVRTDGRKPLIPLGGLLSMLTGSAAQLVYRMPVDQEFTMHAGRFIWGYPKYLARIDVSVGEDAASVRLVQDGELVFALAAPASRKGRPFATRGKTVTAREGILRSISASIAATGVSWRLGGEPPEIGTSHPLAQELRSLGLPKTPFLSASIRHARMRFEGACELRTDVRSSPDGS